MFYSQNPERTPGLPPGTLTNHHQQEGVEMVVEHLTYNLEELTCRRVGTPEDIVPESGRVTWVSVRNHHLGALEALGKSFQLHSLLLEDINDETHRPKIELHDDYLFLIIKYPQIDENHDLTLHHVALVLGANWLISFHRGKDLFQPIRDRLQKRMGRIRKMSADYLAYALLDTMVDHYFPILANFDSHVEFLDQELLEGHLSADYLAKISLLKRNLLALWKVLWSMREIVSQLGRSDNRLVSKKIHVFLRDTLDHLSHQVELTDMLRLRLDDLGNLYLNRITLRSNEIMKTLTIIGSIFIPLTFLAGLYGMNFVQIPLLNEPYGFSIVFAVMVGVAACLLAYFKHRNWL